MMRSHYRFFFITGKDGNILPMPSQWHLYSTWSIKYEHNSLDIVCIVMAMSFVVDGLDCWYFSGVHKWAQLQLYKRNAWKYSSHDKNGEMCATLALLTVYFVARIVDSNKPMSQFLHIELYPIKYWKYNHTYTAITSVCNSCLYVTGCKKRNMKYFCVC